MRIHPSTHPDVLHHRNPNQITNWIINWITNWITTGQEIDFCELWWPQGTLLPRMPSVQYKNGQMVEGRMVQWRMYVARKTNEIRNFAFRKLRASERIALALCKPACLRRIMSSGVRILAFPKEAAFDILLTFTNSVIGYTMCAFKFFHDSIHIHIGCTYLIF